MLQMIWRKHSGWWTLWTRQT